MSIRAYRQHNKIDLKNKYDAYIGQHPGKCLPSKPAVKARKLAVVVRIFTSTSRNILGGRPTGMAAELEEVSGNPGMFTPCMPLVWHAIRKDRTSDVVGVFDVESNSSLHVYAMGKLDQELALVFFLSLSLSFSV